MTNEIKLRWDGSNLGDISNALVRIEPVEYNKIGNKCILKIDGLTKCFIFLYKDDIPLILDEIKPIFGLEKIGRHKCTINKKKYILARLVDDKENVLDHITESHKKEQAQDVIIFRHIMGLTSHKDFMWCRNSNVLSFRDVKIVYEKSTISNTLMKKYFDDIFPCDVLNRLVNHSVNLFSREQKIQLMLSKIRSVVSRINNNLIYLCNDINVKMNSLIAKCERND